LEEHSRLIRFIEKQLSCDLIAADDDENNELELVETGGDTALI
jgi:hypothetical protein